MIATLIILIIAAALFVTGKVRSDLVAICSLLALLVCQILTPEEGLAGFSNSTVIMMVGLFVVGGGIFQTGLAKMISSKIMLLAGKSELRLFLLVMLVTGTIGSFVSNTGTVAVMMPIVVSMAASAGTSSRRLLMPLAFASSMGGMMTLIGTPPNLIVSDTLKNAGYDSLSFFSFLPVGLITLSTGIIFLLPLTKIFLSPKDTNKKKKSGKTLDDLVGEYGLTGNLFRVHVKDESSQAIGKTIAELNIYHNYGINVLELRRSAGTNRFVRTVNQKLASPDLILKQGDVLYLSGNPEDIHRFSIDYSLRLLDRHTDEMEYSSTASMDFFDIGVAEVLFLPTSTMTGRIISEIGFRNKFNVNVLGIRRRKDYILKDIGSQKIQDGDVILVQGAWSDIARLKNESSNWVVLGEPLKDAQKVTLDHKAPIAAAIMIAMITMMVFESIPIAPVTSVLIAAVLMVVTGCVRSMEAAYKSINWQTILLFAAMLPMSTALEKTGVSASIADAIVGWLGNSSPLLMLAGIYAATSIMTIFISNTVTAVLMAPIALQCATQIGISPVPFMFAVTVAASMCFASPFSTPPNALVMSAGQYTFMDYLKVGLPMQIIMGVVMVFSLPLLFPF